MKLLLIGNCTYFPITNVVGINSNKYVAGDISGNIFLSEIFTLEEIKEKWKNSSSELYECSNLHDLTKTWGTRPVKPVV